MWTDEFLEMDRVNQRAGTAVESKRSQSEGRFSL